MKPLTLFTALLFIALNTAVAQDLHPSVKYMEEVTAPIGELKNATWQYLSAITKGKGARKVDAKRKNLIEGIRDARATVQTVKPYNAQEGLKDAVLSYLDLTSTVLKEDFDKILDMEAIAEQSYDAMEAYLTAREQANEKLDSASNFVTLAEKQYAIDNNIALTEAADDKLTKKIKRASESLEYYNDVYLIFFKAYKQEVYVLDALNRQDVSAMEQNNGALADIAAEGKAKVKATKSFKGDPTLRTACTQLMTFYEKESSEYFAKMVDFYVAKDNFEKVQKMMESKSKKSRTKEDVDQYNNAANTYNAAVNDYNAVNQKANAEREQQLENWNKRVEAFFAKHSE